MKEGVAGIMEACRDEEVRKRTDREGQAPARGASVQKCCRRETRRGARDRRHAARRAGRCHDKSL